MVVVSARAIARGGRTLGRHDVPHRAHCAPERPADRPDLTARLPPDQWFPAGRADISARRVTLAGGLGLRVLEAGPPDGTPLLLLHGWAISAYLWRHNIAALAGAGYHLLAPDLPGHGLSDAPLAKGSYTLEALADDLGALLDALELDRTAVVAQSMGGRIALELARRDRVTRLALFAPVGLGEVSQAREIVPFLPKIPGALATMLVPREIVEIVQRRVYGKVGWFTDRDVDEYWAPTQFPAVVQATVQMLREFDWEVATPEALARITTPTLVVFGTLDRTVRPDGVERLVG
ncbi:MAG: alpha/beta fold hydrolase, partial [Gemmatimonadaceae bacterium]